MKEMPREVKLIHKSVARTRDIVLLVRVLKSEGHKEMAAKHLDIERRIPVRQTPIGKAFDLMEMAVEDVDEAIMEVSRVEVGMPPCPGDRKSLEHGAGRGVVDRDHRMTAVDPRTPPRDCPVLCREDERRRCRASVTGDFEATMSIVEY